VPSCLQIDWYACNSLEACTEAGMSSVCRGESFSKVSFLVDSKFAGPQVQLFGTGVLPTAARGCAWDMLVGLCRG
jgi:hypothetical protein